MKQSAYIKKGAAQVVNHLTCDLHSVPVHARKLVVRAPMICMHPPCTRRNALEVPAEQVDSTTPGHSPSIGHNTPPN
ncbi:hypothetical protein DAI22_06g278100 [Oryza sativa Japonica Group]|nr:hypothetical protein DAI22_06g278100 [Oryza sativa Japonica Group]